MSKAVACAATIPEPVFTVPEPELLAYAAKRKSNPVYTGALLARNLNRCEAICTDLLSGVSQRQVAQRYNVSRHSLRAVVDVMECAGELAPLKARVQRKTGQLVETALDEAQRMIDDQLIPAHSIAVFMGVSYDKWSHSNGDATSRVEITHTQLPTADDLVERAKRILGKMAATEPKLKQANAIEVPPRERQAG